MTDFLSAIARRALGEATELRPAVSPVIPPVGRDVPGARLPALFAGDPDVAVSGLGAPSDSEDGDDQGSERSELLLGQGSPRSPGRGRRSGPARGSSPARSGQEEPAEADERTSADRGRGRPEAGHEMVTVAAAGEDGGRPTRDPLSPAGVPRDATPTLIAQDPGPSGSAHDRPEPAEVSPFTPATVVVADQLDNAVAVPIRWPDDDEDGPTTVHVSIGRIEVRAPSPAAQAPPAPRPTQPRLSLDDYLRRRDGGRGS